MAMYFYKQASSELVVYCNADWASDETNRRSTSGYVFLLQRAPISCSSKKQQIVATSSCKAEYMSLAAACQEAIWLRSIIRVIEPEIIKLPTLIYVDNKEVVDLARTNAYKPRTKHIIKKYHFIGECIDQGNIKIQLIGTNGMIADFLTMPLTNEKFGRCIKGLHIQKKEDLP
ncbi:hypothetical protein TKK_0014542 [Trichogramma kaykai]